LYRTLRVLGTRTLKEVATMSTTTQSITQTAREFFNACDTGAGWDGCRPYCEPAASFSSQAEPLAEMRTLEEYVEWMKGIIGLLPDGRYEVRSFATDEERGNVCIYAVFSGTHTGEGGPVPPTGRRLSTDYVYVIHFDGGKIRHMTKIWDAGSALKQVGWAG
jgi:predicted ester cyclase